MPITIDYYASLNSPWTYLGSAPFAAIAKRHGATVNVKPAKFGPIFEQTGGLPLPKRSPQRQAYRLMELKRWREVRERPLHLEPRHFPCDDIPATRLVIAAKLQGKDAHLLSLEFGRALWEREEKLADPATIAAAAERAGLDAAVLRGRPIGCGTRRTARAIHPGSRQGRRVRRAELRFAVGRNLLGPGPARSTGSRFEDGGVTNSVIPRESGESSTPRLLG
jgi:2-hydroxychromene-2-carboxylate isomerase